MADADSNKRRRLSAADDTQQGPNCLSDLPSGILAHAANFLAPPSRALFAIALDENSTLPNERSSAIAGNQWDVLDFGDIEKELAAKLSDDYIERVLLCIDAVNKLKRLKLTNCVNITGAGLEPLRGSAIIEQIDLSLVGGNQSPRFRTEPTIISCDHVLPILDSIIEREGFALKYLQFPHVWRAEPPTWWSELARWSEFHQFLVRYNQVWRNRGAISCLECNQNLPDAGNEWIETGTNLYGIQRHTCYGCLRHYCYNCETEEMDRYMMITCIKCDRDYCADCLKMQQCRGCVDYYCIDCFENECLQCNEKICAECVEGGLGCYKCQDCDKVFCDNCNIEVEDSVSVRICDECHDTSCNDCRLQKNRQGLQGCAECIKEIAPLLADENRRLYEELELMKVEVKDLTLEVKDLKLEIKELKLENKELRSGD